MGGIFHLKDVLPYQVEAVSSFSLAATSHHRFSLPTHLFFGSLFFSIKQILSQVSFTVQLPNN